MKPPKHEIVNGLMMGGVPKDLTDLNYVELALISLARIENHRFSFSAGAHKQVRGWHTMYTNNVHKNVQHMNRVWNYFEQREMNSNELDDMEDNSDAVDDDNDNDNDNDNDVHEFSNEDFHESGEAPEPPKIAVILTGPFSRRDSTH